VRGTRDRITMKVYLFRHGEITHDGTTRLIGQTDVPLNETGRNQARWWCRVLEPVAFRQVYCSDLVRSRETAEIMAGNSPASITVLPWLREIDLGQWDGMTREEVNVRFPGEWDTRGRNMSEYRPASGESFADLAARVVPAFETLTRHAEDLIVIVGHAGVNRVVLCHILGMPLHHLFRVRQDYGVLNIIDVTGDSSQVSLMNLRPIRVRAGKLVGLGSPVP
jgi:alpha-ribazole phosphatase